MGRCPSARAAGGRRRAAGGRRQTRETALGVRPKPLLACGMWRLLGLVAELSSRQFVPHIPLIQLTFQIPTRHHQSPPPPTSPSTCRQRPSPAHASKPPQTPPPRQTRRQDTAYTKRPSPLAHHHPPHPPRILTLHHPPAAPGIAGRVYVFAPRARFRRRRTPVAAATISLQAKTAQ